MSLSTIPAFRVVYESISFTGELSIPFNPGGFGAGGGGGSGGTVPGVGETAPAIPVVIKSRDWVTNEQIKILVLEIQCISAAFRVWLIKIEKYLNSWSY